MASKVRLVRTALRKIVVPLAVVLAIVSVAADGPVNIVAGVTLTSDNNDSEGETWGRPGGRTVVYSVANTDGFDTLWFGATSLPSAAFDNAVNAAGETMTFDGSSNLAAGVARWTGVAFLPLASGQPLSSQNVQTRFTMTITNAGNAGVAMSNFAGGPTPGIDVKTVGNSFSVNMLFEALAPSGFANQGQWVPILNFYDAAPTPIGNPPDDGGPALTGFSRGFYFTNTGLSLEEHDANITAQITLLSSQVNSVKGDTSFTRAEVTGGLQGLATTLGEVRNSVSQTIQPGVQQIQSTAVQTQNKVNDIYNLVSNQGGLQIPPDLARQSDVTNAKENITQILMILLGMQPCPLPADQCAALTFMPQVARQTNLLEVQQAINALPTQANVAQVQQVLNTLATAASVEQVKQHLTDLAAAVNDINATLASPAATKLDLQVVELTEADSAHTRRWLLQTSLNGAPAAALLERVMAISTDKKKPPTLTDVTTMAVVTPLMPGLISVVVDVSKPNLADLAFHFSVSHVEGTGVMQAGILIGDTKK